MNMSDNTNEELDTEAIQKKKISEMTTEEMDAIAQESVQNAINEMHARGIATVEVDSDGKQYLRHPDGRLTPIIKNEPENNTMDD